MSSPFSSAGAEYRLLSKTPPSLSQVSAFCLPRCEEILRLRGVIVDRRSLHV